MEFCSLFSGSSGNSLFIKEKQTSILCDAGKNGKQVELALNKIDETAKDLNAIIITHEHSDHIAAAGVLSRRYNIPIYANKPTWEQMIIQGIGKIKPENQKIFDNEKDFDIGDLNITPFKTSHDAASSVGFILDNAKNKMGIATDTGIITQDMRELLKDCKLTVLESNHDLGMLENGFYPYHLKRRIKSKFGHLSNITASKFAKDLIKGKNEIILLAHLSRENNIPQLALQTMVTTLETEDIKPGKDVRLEVLLRDSISSKYTF